MHKTFELTDNLFQEDNVVKEYMIKYGIDNVRGGTYSRIRIGDETKKFLINEIYHAENRCFNCGIVGHYVTNCKVPIDYTENKSCGGYIVTFGKYSGQPLRNVPIDYIENFCRQQPNPRNGMKELLDMYDGKI